MVVVFDDVVFVGVNGVEVEVFWVVICENIIICKDIVVWVDFFVNGVDLVIGDEDKDFVVEVLVLLFEGLFDGDIWGVWIKVVKEVIGCKGCGLFMLLCKVLMG